MLLISDRWHRSLRRGKSELIIALCVALAAMVLLLDLSTMENTSPRDMRRCSNDLLCQMQELIAIRSIATM